MIFGGNKRRQLQEKLEEKNRRLRETRQRVVKLREQADRKDQEIEALRSQLARFQEASGSPSQLLSDTPVFFLVGQGKSGTSWLMRMLDAHPEILCKGEGRFFGLNYKSEDIKNMQSKTLQPSSLYRAILDADYLNAWVERSVWTRDDDKDAHLDNLTRLTINHFLTAKLSKTGKRIVGDKTPFYSGELMKEIQTVYPEARVIHIIRDGRDVATSAIHHMWNHASQEGGSYGLTPEQLEKREAYRADPQAFLASGQSIFASGQLATTAGSWVEVVGRAMEDGPKLLGQNYAEVRYEDLLEKPEPDLERLLKFLGADASEATVARCVRSASFENWAKGRRRGQEDSTAFMRKGIAGDWKNVFTEEDKRVFKEAAGDMLVKLGYEKGYDW